MNVVEGLPDCTWILKPIISLHVLHQKVLSSNLRVNFLGSRNSFLGLPAESRWPCFPTLARELFPMNNWVGFNLHASSH